MRGELKKLFRHIGAPVLYVTHDQSEAMSLADEVILLCEGRVAQNAPPYDLYRSPLSLFVAQFVGSPRMNVWRAMVNDGALDGDGIHAAAPPGMPDVEKWSIGIRPEDVEVLQTKVHGAWEANVLLAEPLGGRELLTLRVARHEFRALSPPLGGSNSVWVRWPADKLHWFESESGKRYQPPGGWDTLVAGGLMLQV